MLLFDDLWQVHALVNSKKLLLLFVLLNMIEILVSFLLQLYIVIAYH